MTTLDVLHARIHAWATRVVRHVVTRESARGSSVKKPDSRNTSLSQAGWIYVSVVVAGGATVIAHSVLRFVVEPPATSWAFLTALTLFTGLFSIRVPSLGATISASEPLVFTAALVFGPAAATLTVALDGCLVSLRAQRRIWYRVLFNVAEPAVSVWCAAQAFYGLAGMDPLSDRLTDVNQLVVPLLVLIVSYFLLNSAFTATAIFLETRQSPVEFLRSQLPNLSIGLCLSACMVFLVVRHTDEIGFVLAVLMVPWLVVSQFSSKTSAARVEEANQHLGALNRLYLSTIESLAAAIDAKDQVTHGHIRRVQLQAVALARALGIQDANTIKALEAAALLHDIGKIGIPDHILNKPGRLTQAEFEVMKRHVIIGADILSTVDFPFPVIPTVRCHHESWDGTGYPEGLRGADIPIGARILTVVDCFDALTSDRPYRPAMSTEEALQILRARRGNMYDPRVVDVFIELQPTLASRSAEAMAMENHAHPALAPHIPDTQAATVSPSGKRPTQTVVAQPWAEPLVRLLLDLLPDCLAVVYEADPHANSLVARAAAGAGAKQVVGHRIQVGHGVSGWVAASGGTVDDTDAVLDLAGVLPDRELIATSCTSIPLTRSGSSTVITVYGPRTNARVRAGTVRSVSCFVEQLRRSDHPGPQTARARAEAPQSGWSVQRT